jgi:cytochrome c
MAGTDRRNHRDQPIAGIARRSAQGTREPGRAAPAPAAIIAILSLLAGSGAVAQTEMEIAKAARCLACHAEAEQRLGPSFEAIAERYAGDDTALATLTERLRAGSRDVWGKAPMPPVPTAQLGDDDLRTLLGWILARR